MSLVIVGQSEAMHKNPLECKILVRPFDSSNVEDEYLPNGSGALFEKDVLQKCVIPVGFTKNEMQSLFHRLRQDISTTVSYCYPEYSQGASYVQIASFKKERRFEAGKVRAGVEFVAASTMPNGQPWSAGYRETEIFCYEAPRLVKALNLVTSHIPVPELAGYYGSQLAEILVNSDAVTQLVVQGDAGKATLAPIVDRMNIEAMRIVLDAMSKITTGECAGNVRNKANEQVLKDLCKNGKNLRVWNLLNAVDRSLEGKNVADFPKKVALASSIGAVGLAGTAFSLKYILKK